MPLLWLVNGKRIDSWNLAAKDPKNWRVIKRENVLPITALLKQPDRDKINDIIRSRLKAAWPSAALADLVRRTDPHSKCRASIRTSISLAT